MSLPTASTKTTMTHPDLRPFRIGVPEHDPVDLRRRRGEPAGQPAKPPRGARGSPGSRLRPRWWGQRRRPLVALAVLTVVGMVAAGCGGGSSGSGGSGSGGGGYGYGGPAPSSGGPSGAATVAAASTKLGTILVDGSGRTLYLFAKDQPDQSACAGACAAAWPVDQTSGAPRAGDGVKASLLGSIKRGDGTTQVTYNQHPLYYYSGDNQAGQQNGQGIKRLRRRLVRGHRRRWSGDRWLIGTGPARPAPPRCPGILGRWPGRRWCRGSCGSPRPPPWGSTRSCTGRTRRPTTLWRALSAKGALFRAETAVAVAVGLLILVRPRTSGWVAAVLVAASALGAVVLYRYVDLGALGPLPDMYEDTWQVPGKLLSAYAEGTAVVLAGLGLLTHREHSERQRLVPTGSDT
jgi:predicted lipoprotein with Yx(FWY)xxD motif